MIVVLPFENLSGGKKHDYFSEGMTEEMITRLARLNPERLGVIARTSAMQYKSTDKSVRQIGGELGVSHLLEGSVRRSGSRVRVAIQLIQVSDESHLWAESYERDLDDLLTLQFEVAEAVAKEIQIKLAPQEQERLASAATVNPQAYEAYLKGHYLLNRRTLEALQKSVQYFKKSIEHDGHYAVAFAGLADSYLTHHDLGHLPPREATAKAKAAARKALAIDGTLAEAHTSLGHAHFHEFNWLAADRDLKRAIKLNSNYANAHFYYANYLIAVGKKNEAIAEVNVQEQEGGLRVNVEGEDAQGNPIHVEFTAKYDGKDYSMAGSATTDTIALKRIDANTIETTSKKNGEVVTTVRSVVSKDGKTRTSTWKGKNAKGEPETWVAVYDKQ